MKKLLLLLAVFTARLEINAQTKAEGQQVCWLETSQAVMDGAMGGAGLQHTEEWDSTVSAILIRHAKGHVLLDTGFGPNAEAQMNELPSSSREFGLQVVAGSKERKPLSELLASVDEPFTRVDRIVLTHTHYDHLGGATTLSSPIYIPEREIIWLDHQAAHPTITPPSLIAEVKPRLTEIKYDSGPFLGFSKSKDLYQDGTIVIVPLPGHTPGSQGVFVKLGSRRVFFLGDAADTVEAAERGLPKSPAIRSATDFDPALADATTKQVAAFHHAHPEIRLIPAHDRSAFLAAFERPSSCITSFPATQGAGGVAR